MFDNWLLGLQAISSVEVQVMVLIEALAVFWYPVSPDSALPWR